MQSDIFMQQALHAAKQAEERGEVPIGAVITYQNEILAVDGNRTREMNDPTAHAEILVIRDACRKLGTQRIPDCELYVTLEPCTMCAAAISFARLSKLFIGALDKKGGAVVNGVQFFNLPSCHHKNITIEHGLLQEEGSHILKEFFKRKRKS